MNLCFFFCCEEQKKPNSFIPFFLGESMARQSVFGFICPLEADLVYQNVNELEFELSKM